jgi:hypothetical protein
MKGSKDKKIEKRKQGIIQHENGRERTGQDKISWYVTGPILYRT